MDAKYSLENPLGFTTSRYEHKIAAYLSWYEVYQLVTSGTSFISQDGIVRKFPLSDSKDRLPLFTYKGDFGAYQSGVNFRGERSPYVVIDLDLNEALSGFNKAEATASQRAQVDCDFEKILHRLSGGSMRFFFMKRSQSVCGSHIVIKLDGADPQKIPLYEEAIMAKAQEQIDALRDLNYHYKVDPMMKVLNQSLYINHDPQALFDQDCTTPASSIELPEYHTDYSYATYQAPGREASPIDKNLFKNFATFCCDTKVRLPYNDIFRLGIIWICLYPNVSREEFIKDMAGFNAVRSLQRGNPINFLSHLYDNTKKSNATYSGKRITIDSLYYFLGQYDYDPAGLTLHFNGYLENIKDKLIAALDSHTFILLKAPTGAGKTRTFFGYIKDLARENPERQYVIALPYTTMVDQFALENSDNEFAIQVLHSAAQNSFPAFIKQEVPKTKAVQVIPDEGIDIATEMVSGEEISLLERVEHADESTRHLMKNGIKKKKKKKDEPQKTVHKPLIEMPKPKLNNIWVTTTDSAKQVKHLDVLVVDEAHDLVKQYGFRPDAVNSLDGISADKIIYVTATPDALIPEVLGAYFINCVKDDRPRLKLSVVQVSGSVLVVLEERIRNANSTLSFYNDKKICVQIKNDLGAEGIDVTVYTSDVRKDDQFKTLSEDRVVAKHSITTSILQEGINIENDDIDEINIVNEWDIDNIIQAAARPRKCSPRINLIFNKNPYTRNRTTVPKVKLYQIKMSYYKGIAERLNTMVDNGKATGNDRDTFSALDKDYQFIVFDRRSQSYRVDEFRVKYQVNVEYAERLYRFCYDEWLKELQTHFIVDEIDLSNEIEEPDTSLDFDLFKNAGDDVIMAFYQYEKLKKNNRRLRMPSELMQWSEAHGKIQWHRDFRAWTDRYVTMKDAGAIDWKTIKSSIAFAYWKRRHNFTQSVITDNSSAKDVRVKNRSVEIVGFILAQDTAKRNLDASSLFDLLNSHLKISGFKVETSQKLFYHKIASVVEIETKQNRNGERYISKIKDRRAELMPPRLNIDNLGEL